MPISKMKLTMEAMQPHHCHGCDRHDMACHGKCEDYAAEVILSAIGSVEHRQNQKHSADMYHVERDRAKRGLR